MRLQTISLLLLALPAMTLFGCQQLHDPVPGHFDPLNINGIPMPYSAPNWALADAVLPVAGQSYSLKDANEKLQLEGAA